MTVLRMDGGGGQSPVPRRSAGFSSGNCTKGQGTGDPGRVRVSAKWTVVSIDLEEQHGLQQKLTRSRILC